MTALTGQVPVIFAPEEAVAQLAIMDMPGTAPAFDQQFVLCTP